MKPTTASVSADAPGFRPLYRQVRDMLVTRIAQGEWAPGAPLPSEMELAAALGVSQGTVRKALDELTGDNLLVRRQGRGTYVAEHDEKRILFQFFKLRPDDGAPGFPDSRTLRVAKEPASPECRARLRLGAQARVVCIRRVRRIGGQPAIIETIRVPAKLFPGIETGPVPNNLYQLYAQRFAITIGGATEKLKAVLLGAEDAAHLHVAAGLPALSIDRVAVALDRAPVEWRVSLCLTETQHYLADLR